MASVKPAGRGTPLASTACACAYGLLAIVFAADVVSSEFSQGTIKLLLTRPVSRTAVLASAVVVLFAVSVLLGSYTVTVPRLALGDVTSPAAAVTAVLHGNARRFYNLGGPGL